MGCCAAVRVDDDLPPGEAGVPHRPADHELPGRVDVEEVLGADPGRIEQVAVVRVQDRLDNVLDQVRLQQGVAVDPVTVLGRDQKPLALALDRRPQNFLGQPIRIDIG